MVNQENPMAPEEIEARSFAIITDEIGDQELDPLQAPIIKRVIHTTADFSYLDTLTFTENAVESGLKALRAGATIVTDTNMALSGINKGALAALGCKAACFMADAEVAAVAKAKGTTRAAVSMDRAAKIEGPVIFAVGNAPTALFRLCDHMETDILRPALIVGVPVGFVNVVESKERVLDTGVPAIVARGRKGGSTVAAAICNALLYTITRGNDL